MSDEDANAKKLREVDEFCELMRRQQLALAGRDAAAQQQLIHQEDTCESTEETSVARLSNLSIDTQAQEVSTSVVSGTMTQESVRRRWPNWLGGSVWRHDGGGDNNQNVVASSAASVDNAAQVGSASHQDVGTQDDGSTPDAKYGFNSYQIFRQNFKEEMSLESESNREEDSSATTSDGAGNLYDDESCHLVKIAFLLWDFENINADTEGERCQLARVVHEQVKDKSDRLSAVVYTSYKCELVRPVTIQMLPSASYIKRVIRTGERKEEVDKIIMTDALYFAARELQENHGIEYQLDFYFVTNDKGFEYAAKRLTALGAKVSFIVTNPAWTSGDYTVYDISEWKSAGVVKRAPTVAVPFVAHLSPQEVTDRVPPDIVTLSLNAIRQASSNRIRARLNDGVEVVDAVRYSGFVTEIRKHQLHQTSTSNSKTFYQNLTADLVVQGYIRKLYWDPVADASLYTWDGFKRRYGKIPDPGLVALQIIKHD